MCPMGDEQACDVQSPRCRKEFGVSPRLSPILSAPKLRENSPHDHGSNNAARNRHQKSAHDPSFSLIINHRAIHSLGHGHQYRLESSASTQLSTDLP